MASKTPISILEELVVSKRELPPSYHFESIGNQINPEFRCTASAFSITVSETARSKKDAKQRAAAKLLETIPNFNNNLGNSDMRNTSSMVRITNEESYIPQGKPTYYTEGINYVGLLNEYASKNKCLMAVGYEDSRITGDNFEVSCKFDTFKTVGYGRTKKNAKQVAACEMLHLVKESKYIPQACEIPKKSEFLDTSSSDAISKYKELATSGPITTKKLENTPLLELSDDQYTYEEAENMLKKLNLNYQVETIQTDPYFVVVHVDGPIHAMGIGENKHVATERALNQTLRKIHVHSLNNSEDTSVH